MKEWDVTLPVCGYLITSVQAETEEEAIETALNDYAPSDLESWSAVRQITRGNVCYAEVNTASAECVSRDGDS